jgi:hypothetical protein
MSDRTQEAYIHQVYQPGAAAGLKPLKENLPEGQGVEVIAELDSLLKKLRGSRRQRWRKPNGTI